MPNILGVALSRGSFTTFLFCAALVFSSPLLADDEASNVPHIVTDEYGRCFAHSIPDDYYQPGGKTYIYTVGEEMALEHSYPWFAQQIYIVCNVSDGKGTVAPAVVQMGPWPRGDQPNDETLAIAFHYDGKELARYSTLEISGGDPKNASCSVSHYTVIQSIEGIQRFYDDRAPVFHLTTIDGRQLTFNMLTGSLEQTQNVEAERVRGACF